MSNKNFMAYGDAETILTEYANGIKGKEEKFKVTSLPTPSATYENTTYQYIGTTTTVAPIYKHNYFYECKAQGTDPETYAWEQVNVQPTSEGDSRVKPEITEIGVRIQDGYRPYIKVDLASIIPAFEDASLDDIATIADSYYNGDLTLEEIQDVWKLGDTKNITIDGNTVSLTIVDFEHDTLTTPQGENTEAFMTIGATWYENMSNNALAYSGSSLRTWCNSTFVDSLPATLKNIIKSVEKQTGTAKNIRSSSPYYSLVTNSDMAFIPTIMEFIGHEPSKAELNTGDGYWGTTLGGTWYEAYKKTGIRTKTVITSSNTALTTGGGTNYSMLISTTATNGANLLSVGSATGVMPHFCI